MFKEMRRINSKIDEDECSQILEKGMYGILSTIGEDNYPYGVPVNYAYADGRIYFHCAVEGKKLDNLKYSDKVSFCVVGDSELVPENFTTKYESVIIFGRAEELPDDKKGEALLRIIEKYSKGYIDKGNEYIKKDKGLTKVYGINIEYMSGKARR